VSKETKSPYLPFGAGRHRCIDEKSAYLNFAVIVATLVREFLFYNPEDRVGVPETDYSVCFFPISSHPVCICRTNLLCSLFFLDQCSLQQFGGSVGAEVLRGDGLQVPIL
jgi:hypothetical protein